jgi:hypothetical protein
MITILLSGSILLWLSGFLSFKGLIPLRTDSLFEMSRVIVPPKWLFYLCGAPKSKDYPPNSITVGAFRAQITGIVFGIFSVFISWRTTQNGILIGLSLSILIPILLTLWLSKSQK